MLMQIVRLDGSQVHFFLGVTLGLAHFVAGSLLGAFVINRLREQHGKRTVRLLLGGARIRLLGLVALVSPFHSDVHLSTERLTTATCVVAKVPQPAKGNLWEHFAGAERP